MNRVIGNFKKGKKGLSPVIATVLLISIVVAIGVIVFLWLSDFTEEAIKKNDENVELVCGDVNFRAEYSNGLLSVSNSGNIPIYDFKLRVSNGGNYEEYRLNEISGENEKVGMSPGEVSSNKISNIVGSDTDSILLMPVLLGNSESGTDTYECEEKDGKELTNF